MLKTVFFGGAAAAAVAAVLAVSCFGWDAGSYVWTGLGRVQTSVRESVPVEFEIQRAKQMIAQLDPDIRLNMHAIAEGEVAVSKLEKQIADMRSKLHSDKQVLLRLKDDVSKDQHSYTYGSRTYTISQVKVDLARKFDRYKVQEETVSKLEQILDARQRTLDAAQQKLAAMQAAKKQLEVDVEHLHAQLALVQAAQTTSSYTFDDSQLSRTKELMERIQTRLDVASKLLNIDESMPTEINVEEASPDNIVDEVTRHLDHDGAEGIALDSKELVTK